jgi:hypothetical protein
MSDNLEKQLGDAAKRESEIASQLSRARAGYAAAAKALEHGNLEDIFEVITAAEQSERRVRELEDALTEASMRSREAENLLRQERDRIKREVEVTMTRSSNIESAFANFCTAAEPLIAALQQAGTIESNNVADFLRGSVDQLSDPLIGSVPVILNSLKRYADDVMKGGKKRGKKPVPDEQMRAPETGARKIYFIEHCKWKIDGQLVTARQFSTHEVPEPLASKALMVHAAVDPLSEDAAHLRSALGDGYAISMDPATCVDLDLLDASVDLQQVGPLRVLLQQQAAMGAQVA